jgi:hypothetical protein
MTLMGAVRAKFREILREAQETNKVVSVYHEDGGSNKFEVGFIEHVGSYDCTMMCLTPRGEPDGLLHLRLDDVTAIELDDPYTRKIGLLYEYRGSVFVGDQPVNERRSGSMDNVLQRALESDTVVTIQDQLGNDFVGFVSELDEDFVELRLLNSYGAPDGRAVIERRRISRIESGRREEQTRGFLYKYNYDLRRLLES